MKCVDSRSRLLWSWFFCLSFALWMALLKACVVGDNVCEQDSDCYAPFAFCVQKVCVRCKQDSDCKGGRICTKNFCLSKTAETKPQETPPSEARTEVKTESLSEPGVEVKGEAKPDRESEREKERFVPEERGADAGEATPESEVEKGPIPGCRPGSVRACYDGPEKAAGVGLCLKGKQTCDTSRAWGRCVGSVKPTQERCDGKDNDCDGKTDEGCVCAPGKKRDCGTDVGACRKGTQKCSSTGLSWGECQDNVGPTRELCDGKDNDCDGQVDEGCKCIAGKVRSCGTDVGRCQKGKQTCSSSGVWGTCKGSINPAPKELCNKIDDDCDGKIDETFTNLGQKCEVGKGPCLRRGVLQCLSDGSSGCSVKAGAPSKEICNKIDDDCDGKIDETFTNLGQKCEVGNGPCLRRGVIQCFSDGSSGCSVKAGAPSKEICDGKDNDCDGKTDESLLRPLCSRQKGVCANSRKTCGGKLGWRSCTVLDYLRNNSGYQTAESKCDGKDNDCDGSVDETFAEKGKSCLDKTQKGECQNGTTLCVNGALVCRSIRRPVREICLNQKDDDCDGVVDERFGCLSITP